MNIIEIKCNACGYKMNLDNSIMDSIRDSISNDEIEKNAELIKSSHHKELLKIQDEHAKSLQAKESLIEGEYIDKIKLIEEKNDSLKNNKLNLMRQNMELEDRLEETEIKVKEESRKILNNKLVEIELKNTSYQDKLKADIEIENINIQKILKVENQAKIKEQDLIIQRLKKEAEDARSKLDHAQNSQELIGEAAEVLLLERLESAFINDSFEDIKKGQPGADILQHVRKKNGESVGTIYFESKKTKNWSGSWIPKFKEDILKKQASFGILVSEVFPSAYNQDFFCLDGVWVTSPRYADQLATVLRVQLLAIHQRELINRGKDSLEGGVYKYVTSDEFQEKLQVVVEGHFEFLANLEKERIAFQKIWGNREKSYKKSINNIATIVGDLSSLSGDNIKSIDDLELLKLS